MILGWTHIAEIKRMLRDLVDLSSVGDRLPLARGNGQKTCNLKRDKSGMRESGASGLGVCVRRRELLTYTDLAGHGRDFSLLLGCPG